MTEWRQNVDTVVSWFSEEEFDLVTLYFGEPDNVGHAKGPDHPDRKKIIAQIDDIIGYLRDAIDSHGLTDSLNVIITSDHGMTTVKKRPQVDEIILNRYLNLIQLASFEILDYGGFGILTPRPGKEQEVYDALSHAPNLTVYKKHQMPESFRLGRSERLPPIVVMADLGFNLNSVGSSPTLLLPSGQSVQIKTWPRPEKVCDVYNLQIQSKKTSLHLKNSVQNGGPAPPKSKFVGCLRPKPKTNILIFFYFLI